MRASPGEIWGAASSCQVLGYVVKGERQHYHWRDDRLVLQGMLPTGSLNFVPVGVTPRAVVTQGIEMVLLFLPHLDLVLRAREHEFTRSAGLELRDLSGASPDFAIVNLMQALGEALIDGSVCERLWLDSLVNAVCVRLLHKWSNTVQRPTRTAARGLTAAQVRCVCEAMTSILDGGCGKDVTLRHLAHLVDLSPNHFCRAFTQAVGVAPNAWFATYRMERAKALMRNPTMSLSDIAFLVGYENQSSFGRAFQRVVGTAPALWRSRHACQVKVAAGD